MGIADGDIGNAVVFDVTDDTASRVGATRLELEMTDLGPRDEPLFFNGKPTARIRLYSLADLDDPSWLGLSDQGKLLLGSGIRYPWAISSSAST